MDCVDQDPVYKRSTRETVTRIAAIKGKKFGPWSKLSHVMGGMEKCFVYTGILLPLRTLLQVRGVAARVDRSLMASLYEATR